ncbi:MAG: hypothetical protein OXG82_10755 [Gammaproteobacteria bacterium]|nr:hypothetical protein [Gammaproteobacteria bacterium]
MDSKHAASWVYLLARSRPAISVLSVLATVAIAAVADRPGVVIGSSGETDQALEESLVPTAIRTGHVQEALTITVREGDAVLAADQRLPPRLQPPAPHAAEVK